MLKTVVRRAEDNAESLQRQLRQAWDDADALRREKKELLQQVASAVQECDAAGDDIAALRQKAEMQQRRLNEVQSAAATLCR